MNTLPIILLSHLFHREQNCLKLDFEYNRELIFSAKKSGCKWSTSNNCWYLANTKENFNLLFRHFKGVGFLDIRQLKSRIPTFPEKNQVAKKDPKQLLKVRYAKLGEEKKEVIRSYTNFLKGRRYSSSTVSVYGSMIVEFIIFCQNKTVDEINNKDVELFCQQFIAKNNYSISYQRQFIGALKLFAEHFTNCKLDPIKLVRPKKDKKLPIVLSKEEIIDIIRLTKNIKHRAFLTLLYSAGLRIGELLNLKLADIDIDRKQVIVKNGKGRKDRFVVLASAFLPLLNNYMLSYQPKTFFIEGTPGTKYSAESIRAVLRRSCKAAKIVKPVTPHTLRHSYATHLLENGTDLRHIQELLGHSKPETTMIYTHVTSKALMNIKSPLDTIIEQGAVQDKSSQNILLSPKGDG